MRKLKILLACVLTAVLTLTGIPAEPKTVVASEAVPTDAPVYNFGNVTNFNIGGKEVAWYKLIIPETSVIRVGLTCISGPETYIDIYTENGQKMLSITAGDGTTKANYASLLAGSYYIKISPYFTSDSSGSFIAEIIESGQTFPETYGNIASSNDTISTASEIKDISSIHGIVGGSYPADYYKIDVGGKGALLQLKINSYYNKVCALKVIDKSMTNTLLSLSQSDKLADCTLYAGTYYIFSDCGNDPTKYCQSYDIIVSEANLESYSIKYVLNGGTNSIDNPDSYSEGQSLTLADPSKEGFKFDGWYSDSGLTKRVTGIKDSDRGNLTFYAKWTPITYRITYNLDGGKNNSKNKTSYTINTKTFKLKKAKRKGYKFMGWYDAEGNKISKIIKGSTGDITLTAYWEAK